VTHFDYESDTLLWFSYEKIQVILFRPPEESQLNLIKRAGLHKSLNHGTVGALPNIYEKEIKNSIRITVENHNSFSDINLNLTNAL
jgi:hypothetical protein